MTLLLEKGPTGRIKRLRELLSRMTRQDVIDAIQQFRLQDVEPFGFIDSTDYDLLYEGKSYPPKAVFGMAAKRLLGRPLRSDEFSGGEGSPCFAILLGLGFQIERKREIAGEMFHFPDKLVRYNQYSREQISQLFEPGTKFIPQAGRWGISGIVETPQGTSNFVFMVTLGQPHDGNPYHDELTEDGFLIWESQTRHNFQSPTIRKLLAHDPQKHNIHLFLRSSSGQPYTYLGLLEYFSHDPNSANPVHFIWRVCSWDLTRDDLERLNLTCRGPLDPSYSPARRDVSAIGLTKVPPPARRRTAAPVKRKGGTNKTGDEIDWAVQDEKNRQLGLVGEKLVLHHEIDSLKAAGQTELADQVKHVALYNSSAGFDILSFKLDGTPKRIEVKTTMGPVATPFFISINEVLASKDEPSTYWVYRVHDLDHSTGQARFFELNGDVEECCELQATNFRAAPLGSGED